MQREPKYLIAVILHFVLAPVVKGQYPMPDHACTGETRQYLVYRSTGSTCIWRIDGKIQEDETSGVFVHTWTEAGTYLLEVREISEEGCTGPVSEGLVLVGETPSAPLLSGLPPPGCGDEGGSVLLEGLPRNGVWTLGPIDRTGSGSTAAIEDLAPGRYRFYVETSEGCRSPLSEEVLIDSGSVCLQISDVISPNGDLINDSWNIGSASAFPLMEVTIYNRWGQAVWRSGRGYPVPWNGKSRGIDLPVDSYHYIIDLHNGSPPIVGVVTIVR